MARVRTIEISRVFSLADHYEEVRYSITVDVAGTESADRVFENLEHVMEALRPIEKSWPAHLKSLSDAAQEPGIDDAFRKNRENELVRETKKFAFVHQRREKAIRTLNELGGNVTWVDTKKEYEEELKF